MNEELENAKGNTTDINRILGILGAYSERIGVLEDKVKEFEKFLKKSTEKTSFELSCELERIKDILLEETPSGREKPSKFAKLRLGQLRNLKRKGL